MSTHFVPSEGGPVLGLLDTHVESFLAHLGAAGYAERTLRKKRLVVRSFARWAHRQKVSAENLNESHVTAFLRRSPRRRKAQVAFESPAVRLFHGYLQMKVGVVSPLVPVEASPGDALLGDYVDYLRAERGLAENSIHVYAPTSVIF